MKIMIFSDLHSNLANLDNVLVNHKFDRIFGLGDFDVNEYELNERDVVGVKGNSYFDSDYPIDRFTEIEGFKILFTHGHTHNVRPSRLSLKLFAKENNAQIVFYGHTHIARIEEDSNIYLINPGSISIPFFPLYPTFAIMDIDKNKANIKIVDAFTLDVFDEIEIKK